MLCPTIVAMAIDRPIQKIITNCMSVLPTPYAATVSVPNEAIKNVMTVSPSARPDISIEAGSPSKNDRLIKA